MNMRNEEIRKVIERNKKLLTSLRRSDITLQLRQRMVAKGIKNIDLAIRLGVSEANVSRLLKGNQNLGLDTLYQLADAVEEPLTVAISLNERASVRVSNGDDKRVWTRVTPSPRANVVCLEGYRDLILKKRNEEFKLAKSIVAINLMNGDRDESPVAAA